MLAIIGLNGGICLLVLLQYLIWIVNLFGSLLWISSLGLFDMVDDVAAVSSNWICDFIGVGLFVLI
jgi:hypothetical protein